jgi:hypothetical protein
MSSATMTRWRGARSGWLRISAAKASACSSDLSVCMLSCSATGRKVSRTSLVLRSCLARGRNCRVCMLCSLVGQLRGDNPGISGHHRGRCPGHLACRLPAEAIKRHVPGYHRSDPRAELASQRGQRVRGVLDRIVQDRCAQRLVIDLADVVKPGEDQCDRYRVGDVRVAAPAHLALVAPARDLAGPFDQVGVSVRPGGQDDLADLCGQVIPGGARPRHRTVHGDPPQ